MDNIYIIFSNNIQFFIFKRFLEMFFIFFACGAAMLLSIANYHPHVTLRFILCFSKQR